MFSMVQHLARQAAFSRATFGPGARTEGVQKHILKEFDEINELLTEDDRCHEWVDVAILGLDGLLRSISVAQPTWTFDEIAERALALIRGKQARNERRKWPDWRGKPEDAPIEHDRSDEPTKPVATGLKTRLAFKTVQAPEAFEASLVEAMKIAKEVAAEMVGTPWQNKKTGNVYLVDAVDLDSEDLKPRVRYRLLQGSLNDLDFNGIVWSREVSLFKMRFVPYNEAGLPE